MVGSGKLTNVALLHRLLGGSNKCVLNFCGNPHEKNNKEYGMGGKGVILRLILRMHSVRM
jgi:hypothetical protein